MIEWRELWEGISRIQSTSGDSDWLVIGDFNEIRSPEESEGHGPFDQVGANEFNTAVGGLTELDTV